MGEGVSLVREADAGDLHVRFDERRLETERVTRTEVPAMPVNSYSPASRRYRASRRLYTYNRLRTRYHFQSSRNQKFSRPCIGGE